MPRRRGRSRLHVVYLNIRRKHSEQDVRNLYDVTALSDGPPVRLKCRFIVGHLVTIGNEDASGSLVEVLAEPVHVLVCFPLFTSIFTLSSLYHADNRKATPEPRS